MNYFNKVSITVLRLYTGTCSGEGRFLMNASGTHDEIMKLADSTSINPKGMSCIDPAYKITTMQNGGSFYKNRSRVNFWFNGVAG